MGETEEGKRGIEALRDRQKETDRYKTERERGDRQTDKKEGEERETVRERHR